MREAIMLDKLQAGTEEQLCQWIPWDNILRSSLEANLGSSISISVIKVVSAILVFHVQKAMKVFLKND